MKRSTCNENARAAPNEQARLFSHELTALDNDLEAQLLNSHSSEHGTSRAQSPSSVPTLLGAENQQGEGLVVEESFWSTLTSLNCSTTAVTVPTTRTSPSRQEQKQMAAAKKRRYKPYKKGQTQKPELCPSSVVKCLQFLFAEQRNLILDERTHKLKTEGADNSHFNPKTRNAKISFEELAKIISSRWKSISSLELKHYQNMAKQDTARYRSEMEAYNNKKNRSNLTASDTPSEALSPAVKEEGHRSRNQESFDEHLCLPPAREPVSGMPPPRSRSFPEGLSCFDTEKRQQIPDCSTRCASYGSPGAVQQEQQQPYHRHYHHHHDYHQHTIVRPNPAYVSMRWPLNFLIGDDADPARNALVIEASTQIVLFGSSHHHDCQELEQSRRGGPRGVHQPGICRKVRGSTTVAFHPTYRPPPIPKTNKQYHDDSYIFSAWGNHEHEQMERDQHYSSPSYQPCHDPSNSGQSSNETHCLTYDGPREDARDPLVPLFCSASPMPPSFLSGQIPVAQQEWPLPFNIEKVQHQQHQQDDDIYDSNYEPFPAITRIFSPSAGKSFDHHPLREFNQDCEPHEAEQVVKDAAEAYYAAAGGFSPKLSIGYGTGSSFAASFNAPSQFDHSIATCDVFVPQQDLFNEQQQRQEPGRRHQQPLLYHRSKDYDYESDVNACLDGRSDITISENDFKDVVIESVAAAADEGELNDWMVELHHHHKPVVQSGITMMEQHRGVVSQGHLERNITNTAPMPTNCFPSVSWSTQPGSQRSDFEHRWTPVLHHTRAVNNHHIESISPHQRLGDGIITAYIIQKKREE
ncbi:hypothetical protein ACA910_005169 [Epithemia clementina (nom. ined.)]